MPVSCEDSKPPSSTNRYPSSIIIIRAWGSSHENCALGDFVGLQPREQRALYLISFQYNNLCSHTFDEDHRVVTALRSVGLVHRSYRGSRWTVVFDRHTG
jgi:hypothetical protein